MCKSVIFCRWTIYFAFTGIQISLLQYNKGMERLEESKLIYQVFKQRRGVRTPEKPDKIFLENTNLMYMFDNLQFSIITL